MEGFKSRYQLIKYFKGFVITYLYWFFVNGLFFYIGYLTVENYLKLTDRIEVRAQEIEQAELNILLLLTTTISFLLSLFSWNYYFFLESRVRSGVWRRIVAIIVLGTILAITLNLTTTYLAQNVYQNVNFNAFDSFPNFDFIAYFFYLTIGNLLIYTLFSLRDIVGPEMYQSVLRGKYSIPVEENRIFIFMDLVDSTTIAEKLGHIDYSRFIKECYELMTDAIIYHKAAIYQYVGDEIVLSWTPDKGLENDNCLKLYDSVCLLIEKHTDFFKKEFGVVPKFCAGLHMGKVTAVQVGLIKRELAYHGDVLNTTSRLQEKCKDFNVDILTTEALRSQLSTELEHIGTLKLRGKISETEMYTVKKDT